MAGKEELQLALPKIEASKKLPVVLSQQEIKKLINAPKLLKHRVMFGVIYDGGLRISEVINLKIVITSYSIHYTKLYEWWSTH